MRDRFESMLGNLGRLLYRRAVWVVAAAVIATLLAISQIGKIELRVSTDEFLSATDSTRVVYDRFLERFGRDDMIMIVVEPPKIFDLEFLRKLKELHEQLEDEVPHLRDITSLVNARETRGEGDVLVVGELFEDWPETDAELAAIRDRALANPLYPGFILSENGHLTTITLDLEAFADPESPEDLYEGFDEPVEGASAESGPVVGPAKITGLKEAEAVAAVNRIVETFRGPDFMMYVGGTPVVNIELMGSMIRDIVTFTGLSILVIAVVLFAVFRRALAVVIPLSVSILALVSTGGMMGVLGIPAMPLSEVVPSFLLSVGVGGTVHLIVIFQQRLVAGDAREDAISHALRHSGLPIVMTALTTAGGLASFIAADLVPVAIFGVVAPLGILLSLVWTLVLSPALLALLPLRVRGQSAEKPSPTIRLLTALGDFATANAGRVLAVCLVLALVSGFGIARLRFSFNSLDWFPDDMPAKVASKKVDLEMGGAMNLEVVIDTHQENGLHDPDLLSRIERARRTLGGLEVGSVRAGKSFSLVDIVKETHQALNGGSFSARVIPGAKALVAQELLLFENSGSDDLEELVDTQFSQARFSVRVPFTDGSHYPPFAEEVERIFDSALEGHAQVETTGLMVLMGRSFDATIDTMVRSYLIAIAIITPLMMLLLGSFRLGLIAMIPNLFPIVLTMGLMGALDIPIEIFSLLIGSIALGLAVDDTIHFMHGFRRGYAKTGKVEVAVRETLQTTGQALLFTSIVLSLGFAIYVFSDLTNLRQFGMLTAFAITMAFIADVLLAPALMKVTARFSSLEKDA